MNRITNVVLSFFELVEAEGRELRSQTETLARRILLMFFGGLLIFAAVLLVGFAFYAALAPRLGRPAAATSAAVVLAVPGVYALFKGLAKSATPSELRRGEGDSDAC